MDGAEQYVELLAQTGSENEADIKEEHLETNEDLDSSNTYSGVISGTDDDFHKLKNVVCKLEQISDRLALAAIDDQYEHFGKYLATLLRGIPKKKFLSLKQKFVNDIIQAKMALDESTTSSLVTGNCTVTESVVDPIGVGNESSCLDNTCHSSTSKRLQSKGNASEQNVVPVSKTCTNSEPLKVLIIPPTPTITPPVFCPPILLAGDGNSTNNSSSNSLLARKRKRLMTSVPSKKLKKKPRCQPYINYIHHQDEQKTSDEPLPSQATEAVAHAHPLSVTEDHVEIEDENQSENEVSSIDDSDADPPWSPGHINEPTTPGSVVSGYQVIARHLANIYTHLQKVEENQDVMLQSKKIGNPDSSIIFEHNLQIPDVTIPCATNDDILKLEIWLSSSLENRNHMEAFLVRRGGKSVRSFIYRNLEKLFTNQLAKQCNWTGKYGKISIKKLDLTEILHCAVIKNPSTTGATDLEISTAISNWFRFAKDRDGGRCKRRSSAHLEKTSENHRRLGK